MNNALAAIATTIVVAAAAIAAVLFVEEDGGDVLSASVYSAPPEARLPQSKTSPELAQMKILLRKSFVRNTLTVPRVPHTVVFFFTFFCTKI